MPPMSLPFPGSDVSRMEGVVNASTWQCTPGSFQRLNRSATPCEEHAGAKLTIDGSPQGFTAWRDRPCYDPVGSYPPGYAGYSFRGRKLNIPWTYSYAAKHFKMFIRKLGVPDTSVFHCLRHTYASLLLRANTPPVVVARQLGHLNAETTLRTYAHVTDDFMDHEFRRCFKPALLNQPDLFSYEVTDTLRVSQSAPRSPPQRNPPLQISRKPNDPAPGTMLFQLRSLHRAASQA